MTELLRFQDYDDSPKKVCAERLEDKIVVIVENEDGSAREIIDDTAKDLLEADGIARDYAEQRNSGGVMCFLTPPSS